MPFNDIAKNAALDGLDESITAGVKFVGVFTSATEPGTGATHTATEATGGTPTYARQGVTFGAAATGQKSNSASITLDVPPGTYPWIGLFNTVTGNVSGNYLGYAPINGSVKGVANVDTTDVTNDTISSAAHGLTTDDRVQVFNVFAESLPAGLTEGTLYFVLASGLTTDVFKLATTSGGTAINITAVGELYFQKVIPEVFASQGQITIAIGALVLDATAM
jgi:hypothetical protein